MSQQFKYEMRKNVQSNEVENVRRQDLAFVVRALCYFRSAPVH